MAARLFRFGAGIGVGAGLVALVCGECFADGAQVGGAGSAQCVV